MANRSLIRFEKELSELKHRPAPLEWASPKNNLGHVLVALGHEQSDIGILKQSIDDTKEALQECNREENLEEWVTLQKNYAAALHAVGQRDTEETVSFLNEAMEAYKSLLPIIKRQEAPLEWALVLHNIADVSQDLGAHSEGPRTLERSISAYSNALTVRTSNAAPMEWALSQNNAAASMQTLGEIKHDTDILKESVLSYDLAQKKLIQAKNPLAWIIIIGNLGSVRTTLAEQVEDVEIARQAVDNYTDIVEFLQDATNTQHLDIAEKYREKAQAVLQKVG